jgi:hypothetical protein
MKKKKKQLPLTITEIDFACASKQFSNISFNALEGL